MLDASNQAIEWLATVALLGIGWKGDKLLFE